MILPTLRMDNWVKIASLKNSYHAELIKSILIDNNIPCNIINKIDSAYPIFGQAEVYVETKHEEDAKLLLTESELE